MIESNLNDFDSILKNLKQSSQFIIVTHISPDADAIGSSVSLALALRSLKKDACVFLPEPLIQKFKKLVPSGLILEGGEEALKLKILNSVLIGVDCATKKRLGEEVNRCFHLANLTINIDHHESNEKWAQYNWIMAKEAASAILASEIINELNVKITPEIANLLYAGLMDDTGSFRYSNADSKALLVASMFVTNGASPSDVATTLYFEVPERVLRLRARALNTLEVFTEGKISLIYVTEQLLKETGCVSDDTEGLVDMARSIEGVKVAFFLRQIEKGFKVSVRSKDGTIDVNKFAGRFGGGGHMAAAGFTLNLKLEEALELIRKESLSLF